MVVDFALTQSLIKAFAKREVMLLLGALDELLDFPSARTCRLLAVGRLIVLSRDSGLLLLLLSWLTATTTTEHTS